LLASDGLEPNTSSAPRPTQRLCRYCRSDPERGGLLGPEEGRNLGIVPSSFPRQAGPGDHWSGGGPDTKAGPVLRASTVALLGPAAAEWLYSALTMRRARAVLEDRGVTPKAEKVDSGACLMTSVCSPSGNALTLQQRYAPRGLAGAEVATVSATLVFSARMGRTRGRSHQHACARAVRAPTESPRRGAFVMPASGRASRRRPFR
jgi:hypothetical protein